jgi:hypothetical protein
MGEGISYSVDRTNPSNKKYWNFPSVPSKTGSESQQVASRAEKATFSERRGKEGMIAKWAAGLMAAATVFFMLAGPLAAAEKTILLDIPGCST